MDPANAGLPGLYSRLEPSRDEIRLAIILPASSNPGDIHIELVTVPLQDSLHFDALSYVWGPKEPITNILVNGYTFPVGPNLHAALRQFRDQAHEQPVRLWVDAICINQSDKIERSLQVRIMKKIYEHAANVRVWLSPMTTSTELAFRHMNYAMEIDTYHVLEKHDTDSIPGHFDTAEDWIALGALFRNDYWRRRWITQEFTSAKSITIHCGDFVAELRENPVFKIGLLMNYADKCHNLCVLHHHELNWLWGTVTFESAAILAALDPVAQAQSPVAVRNPVELDHFFRSDCTDDKDRVYGVLGLLPEDLNIEPDYEESNTVEAVFEDFAYKYMSWSKSFNLLYIASEFDSSLPSWVPDLRKRARQTPIYASDGLARIIGAKEGPPTRELSFLTSLGKHYSASAKANFTIHHAKDGNLTLRGLEIDKVSAVFSKAETLTTQIIADRGQTDEEFKTEELYADIIQALCCGISRDYADPELPFRRSIDLDTKQYDLAWDCDFDHLPQGLPMLEAQLRKMWLERLEPNQFLQTLNGRIGRCSGDARVGDDIFIIAGSPFPLCLRKWEARDDTYALVGCVYAHGVMDGEAVLAAVGGDETRVDEAFREIHLN